MSAALDLITESIEEDRAAQYYGKWVRDNRVLGPLVESYLDGGARPSDAQIGNNRYGRSLVLAEDARRELTQEVPEAPVVEPPANFPLQKFWDAGFEMVAIIPGPVAKTQSGLWHGDAFLKAK